MFPSYLFRRLSPVRGFPGRLLARGFGARFPIGGGSGSLVSALGFGPRFPGGEGKGEHSYNLSTGALVFLRLSSPFPRRGASFELIALSVTDQVTYR